MTMPYWFDPRKADCLTPEDRQRVIEMVLSWYQDRWVEREIGAASSYGDALRFCLQHVASGGAGSTDYHVEMERDRVYAEIRGRQGTVSWREIIDYVRRPVRQLALF